VLYLLSLKYTDIFLNKDTYLGEKNYRQRCFQYKWHESISAHFWSKMCPIAWANVTHFYKRIIHTVFQQSYLSIARWKICLYI